MNALRSLADKLGAVSEVFFVILSGNILFSLVFAGLIPPSVRNIAFTPQAGNEWPAALSSAVNIGGKLGLVLLMFILLWKLLYRKHFSQANITRNSHSLIKLIGVGVLTFAFANFPWKLIVLVNQIIPFGEGLHGWDAVNSAKFSTGLVVFVLASAMLIPPLLEEISVRGFQLSRLNMSFAPISAILITGIFFPLMHGHFYQKDPVVLLLLVSFIFSSTIYGFIAYRYGSVIPVIIAHSLANAPEPSNSLWMGAIVLVMLSVVFACRAQILAASAALRKLWVDAGIGRFDVLWVIPSVLLVISPVFANRSNIMMSAGIFFGLMVLARLLSPKKAKA